MAKKKKRRSRLSNTPVGLRKMPPAPPPKKCEHPQVSASSPVGAMVTVTTNGRGEPVTTGRVVKRVPRWKGKWWCRLEDGDDHFTLLRVRPRGRESKRIIIVYDDKGRIRFFNEVNYEPA